MERFASALDGIVSPPVARELFALVEQIALTRYEDAWAAGTLILCPHASRRVEGGVRFSEPYPLSDPRGVRKYLEISSSQLALVSNGHLVFGFSRTGPSDPEPAQVRFHGAGTWELVRGDRPLVRRTARRAASSRRGHAGTRLRRLLRRTFPGIDDAQVATLLALVDVAEQQERGTNVLISADAAAEAARLQAQCTRIDPVALSSELMKQLSSIDGTVIIDVDGRCHAIGAILDGAVADAGSRARGGRYNSAVMYAATSRVPCVVVVVSRDGGVDLVPTEPAQR